MGEILSASHWGRECVKLQRLGAFLAVSTDVVVQQLILMFN